MFNFLSADLNECFHVSAASTYLICYRSTFSSLSPSGDDRPSWSLLRMSRRISPSVNCCLGVGFIGKLKPGPGPNYKIKTVRSRLYRGQILQVNTRWKALVEIYTMHSFAPFSSLNFFVFFRFPNFAKCCKFCSDV